MNQCHLKGSSEESLHAVLCAAGFNIRWLLRMIAKKSIGLFLRLLQASGLGHIDRQLREIFTDKSSKSGAMRLTLA
jgi:IS5 family transposase